MADITKIKIGSTSYNVKDDISRTRGDTMLKHTAQSLTNAQKTQARTNIGIGKVGTLSISYVTALEVLCEAGTSVTISNDYLPTQTATAVGGRCVFDLPDDEYTVGTWTVSGSLDAGYAEVPVAIPALGGVYTCNLSLEYPNAELYVSCPFGSCTLTCTKDSQTYTATTTSGSYTFSLDSTGTWTVTMSATNHVSVTKTAAVAQLGGSYYLDMGEWAPTTITVSHPAGADLTMKNGSTYSYDYNTVSTTSTRYNDIQTVGNWTLTASDTSGYHQSMSSTINVSQIGVNMTDTSMSTTWSTVLVEVTHPSGATCTCKKSSTTISGTTSGYTSRFYVTSTGTWTITISATNHADISKTVSVTNMNANGYSVEFDTTWPPAILTVTHPSGADITCKSGSSSVYGTTSGTSTVFEINTAGKTWTLTIIDYNSNHSNATATVSVPTLGSSYTASVSWIDTTITISSYPANSTLSCSSKPSGATVTKTDNKFKVNKTGSYTITATRDGFVANDYTVTISDFNSTPSGSITWKQCSIKVNHPSGATVTCITKPSNATATKTAGTTQDVFKVNMIGDYSFRIQADGHTQFDVSAALVASNMGSSKTIGQTSWKDSTVTIKYSNGCAVAGLCGSSENAYVIVDSNSTSFTYNSYKTVTYTLPELCSSSSNWVVMAYISDTDYYLTHVESYSSYSTSYSVDLSFELPYGYIICSEISASGGGYLDTGISFSDSYLTYNRTFEIKYKWSAGCLGGTYGPDGMDDGLLAIPGYFSGYGYIFAFINASLTASASHGTSIITTVINDSNGYIKEGSTNKINLGSNAGYWYSEFVNGYSAPSIYLFALHSSGYSDYGVYSGSNGTGTIYYFKVTNKSSGAVIANMVPAYQVSTQKYGLYNKTGNQFRPGNGITGKMITSR